MADNQRKPKNENEPQGAALSRTDADLVIGAEDGDGHGHYCTVSLAAFREAIASLSPAWQNVAISGVKYELTRAAQSVAKKARKDKADVNAALSSWAPTAVAKMDPDVERFTTVGTMRVEEARLLTAEKIKSVTGKEASEADVTATLPKAFAKYAAEIESRLNAKLAAGYTPTPRKAGGGAKAAAAAVEI